MNLKLTKWVFTAAMLFAATFAMAQRQSVGGTVIDAKTGDPLVGATVMVKGSTTGVSTDLEGKFTIQTAGGNPTLVFEYLGYVTVEEVAGSRTEINVAMHENSEEMDTVVVIGYGKTTKKEVTGSVASLRSEDFNAGSFTNAAGLFQGKVAGLSVVNASGGDPNGQYELLLRGTNTLAGGQGPLIIIDGVVGEDIRNINFQDVETIDVLKDGSAAAIYGTRGTNGVIIITTKRASSGRTQIEYDGQVTTQTVARRAVPLTAKEFEYVINNYRPSAAASLYGYDTDWFDAITRTPISHKHSLAVSGGGGNFSHRTVLNVEQNQGLQIGNNSNKYLFKTNIHQTAFDGWLDLDYNAMYSKRQYTPSSTSAFQQAFIHNPTEPIYDQENTYSGGYSYVSGAMDYNNPVAMLKESDRQRTTDNFGGNIRATLNIKAVEGLKWDNFFSYKQENYESRSYYTHYYPSSLGKEGEASINNERTVDLQWESTLNYARSFGKHYVQAVLGYTWQRGTYSSSSLGNSGFDRDDWLTDNIGAGAGALNKNDNMSMDSSRSSHTYIALFGRVMYNYDERYLASVSLRRDGSSRFGANHKWGWFPAVSLGWRINQEGFLRDVKWIDELKIRAGFGVTGNQDFANYKSLLLMRASGRYLYNGKWINTYEPKSNANPDLRWEKKAEWNVGVDFSVLGNRLGLTVDYYRRNTTDLLYTYTVPTPPYVYDELFTNVGEIRNEGFEITINAVPVRMRNLVWNTTFILSHNSNKLVKFTNGEFQNGEYKLHWMSTPVGAYAQRLVEGESLGTFYAPVWVGVDSNGNDKLQGANMLGKVPEDKWEKIGNAYPDFTLAWSNSFRIVGNLDFGFTLRASIGGKILNKYSLYYENFNNFGAQNIRASWLDNPYTGKLTYSSKFIEDGSYMKLDNVTLGYTFNFKSKYIRSLRLNFTAQNVLCVTGYKGVDPEVALSGLTPGIESMSYYPSTTSYTLGVNLKF